MRPFPTGEPGTPNSQTKEIVAPNWGEQEILKPIPAPQPEDGDNKRKDMIENPDFNAPDEIEEVPEPDIELPLQVELLQRELDEAETDERDEEFSDGSKRRRRREDQDISLSHHAARCSICQHPDRDAIEQGFLHWESPTLLTYEYGLGRRRAVYRHARALGLFEERGARTRRSLEFVMEQAENTTATASDVIRAVRAYSCLTEDGRWTEPTKRLVVEHVDRAADASAICEVAASVGTGFHEPARRGGSRATGEGFGVFPASSDQPLASRNPTLGDGHAMPSKNAVTRAPSTKPRKLMDTLYRAFSASIGSRLGRRFS